VRRFNTVWGAFVLTHLGCETHARARYPLNLQQLYFSASEIPRPFCEDLRRKEINAQAQNSSQDASFC